MPENTACGIKEYIEWRGDVPFELDPFGEVDALVLAELSYVPFENVLAKTEGGGELPYSLPLRETAARFDKDAVDEKLRIYSFERDAELLKLAGESVRFGDVVASGYRAELSPEKDQQFAAVTFTLPDETRFIAFRGTDDTIVGWKEDFKFSFMYETAAQRLAAEYLERQAEGSFPLMLGGHSKGGNLAVYSAVKCSNGVFARIRQIYSFDAPGFRDEIISTDAYRRVQPLVRSVIPESSLVGQLLTEDTEPDIVRSSATGVMQHEAFTWEVRRNRFVCAEELSRFGTFVNRTVRSWLADMDDENRRMFTKALFDVIEASEADTFGELGKKGKLKSSAALLKALSGLKPEQQAAMRHALWELAKSGKNALKEFAEEKVLKTAQEKTLLLEKQEPKQ